MNRLTEEMPPGPNFDRLHDLTEQSRRLPAAVYPLECFPMTTTANEPARQPSPARGRVRATAATHRTPRSLLLSNGSNAS